MDEYRMEQSLFDLGDSYGEEWRKKAAAGRPAWSKGTPEPENDLRNDYQWLRHFMTWRAVIGSQQVKWFDSQGYPVIKEVYALQHIDLSERTNNEVRKFCEAEEDRFERTHASVENMVIEFCQKLPQQVFYYKMTPWNYFLLYDAPLLLYLHDCQKIQPETALIRELECPECYQSIFDKTPVAQREAAWFGVTIRRQDDLNDGNVITVPAFCKKGRLEAFQRFITYGSKATHVHMFQYYVRCLPDHRQLESVPGFQEEDAWYFEMCTGLSLTVEITALLAELGVKPSGEQAEGKGIVTWSDCRLKIICELLQKHRECIIRCPAIYWRAASIRNVIRQVDNQCRMKELQLERQIYLAYPEKQPVVCPETEQGWRQFAAGQFEYYFFTDLLMIGVNISSKSKMWFAEKCLHDTMGTTLEDPERYFSNIDDIEEAEFMCAAENQVHNLLCADTIVRTDLLMRNAKTAPYTADREKKGFYFRGCLPKEDPVVEDMIGSTRIPSKKSEADQQSLKKLRNANVTEELFEKIHQTLYGTESDSDCGFLLPRGF